MKSWKEKALKKMSWLAGQLHGYLVKNMFFTWVKNKFFTLKKKGKKGRVLDPQP